jgi:hypothetical protein
MKELVRIGTNVVFHESEAIFGDANKQKEIAVDKFLETLRKELLLGRIGEIDTSIDFVGSKNIRVSLEAHKFSVEDNIVKKLNDVDFTMDDLLEMGASEITFTKMPDFEASGFTKRCSVIMPGQPKKLVFLFNGQKWKQQADMIRDISF